MCTVRTLHDAFQTLEDRADAARLPALDLAGPQRDRLQPRHRWAPVSAAAAVAAVAVAAVVLTMSQHARPSRPAGQQAANRPASPLSPTAITPRAASRFRPPMQSAQLAARTRAILAGTATITVTETGTPMQYTAPPAPTYSGSSTPSPTQNGVKPDGGTASGSAIVGTLTAAGRSGGFDLNVFLATPGSKAICDEGTHCSVRPRPDGSTLAVGSWTDPSVPGGVTYQVELVRADGADILLHLSTEQNPKGQRTVTAAQVPLTTDQMIDFVTSDRW